MSERARQRHQALGVVDEAVAAVVFVDVQHIVAALAGASGGRVDLGSARLANAMGTQHEGSSELVVRGCPRTSVDFKNDAGRPGGRDAQSASRWALRPGSMMDLP